MCDTREMRFITISMAMWTCRLEYKMIVYTIGIAGTTLTIALTWTSFDDTEVFRVHLSIGSEWLGQGIILMRDDVRRFFNWFRHRLGNRRRLLQLGN